METEKQAFESVGYVEAVLIASEIGSMRSTRQKEIVAIRNHGIRYDLHAGPRLVDSREDEMKGFGFLKGHEIANHRQWSAISMEELTEVACALNLPARIPYGFLGENLA